MAPTLRPLHLHTLDSLCADLISGRPVGVGADDAPFILASDTARAALHWYFTHKGKWAGNVMAADVEAIVDAVAAPAPTLPATDAVTAGAGQRYTLVSVRAHQFGGLHHPGSGKHKPDVFEFAFAPQATMLEGFNGSGKTSIVNAIAWALTGEILRPQRSPESGNKDFTVEIDGVAQHALPPVTPLPDPSVEKPVAAALPVDTWVELVFEGEDGKQHTVRRALQRTSKGALKEEFTGLPALGLDPIAVNVGTVMPGLLPFIQIGTESKLGKAVSELTGMAPLVKLASHADRARKKLDVDLTRERNNDIATIDEHYLRSHSDLASLLAEHPGLQGTQDIPVPSTDVGIEAALQAALDRFDALKAKGLGDAKLVLGEDFDPDNAAHRSDLVDNIQPALSAVRNLRTLPSSARLSALSKLSEEEIGSTRARIDKIVEEAAALEALAAEPGRAARIRLYARVAAWLSEHETHAAHSADSCAVCGHDLQDAVDPVTGTEVKTHLREASNATSDFLSKTLGTWAQHVLGELSSDLPTTLTQAMKDDLPDHPGALVRAAVVDELFQDDAFAHSLAPLRLRVQSTCNAAMASFPPCPMPSAKTLPVDRKELDSLNRALGRIGKALLFAAWRNANQPSIATFMQSVVGLAPASERPTEPGSLLGVLMGLQSMVSAIEPVNDATKYCNRMKEDIGKRRVKEKRLEAYRVASQALENCMTVGALAEQQVEQLQMRLHKSAVAWRDRIYSSAFPSTSLNLVGTKMGGAGELQLLVGNTGLAAPAQHVANASALRASLVGFFLAYWQHILKVRGGLRLLLLDDPQELLDGDNRERLADSVDDLVKANAQLIMTTHDGRFAASVARRCQGAKIALSHQYVHPATRVRGTLFLSPSVAKVQQAHDAYKLDPDDPAKAQDYVAECRIFLEGRLGDFFDEAVFPTSTTLNFAPTLSDHLQRLRGLVKSSTNELFRSPILTGFYNDAALKDKAPALVLLNKAHHRDKATIRPADVHAVVDDLERVRRAAERIHEEFRLFRRRAPLIPPPTSDLAPLELQAIPSFRVLIQPSLTAFVRHAAVGESQETEFDEIDSSWFDHKAFFYLRADNFGFAGPASSIAIVEAHPSPVEDRRLVIARRAKDIFARRILRPSDSDMIALAAETPDPRKGAQTLLVHQHSVSLHKVVGMLLARDVPPPQSKKEAVQIDAAGILPRVRAAYRIKEDSAVPLALPGQIALGGAPIALEHFDAHIDSYVALHLNDGSSIFKRVGEKLPGPLSHLRRFETIGGLGVADILAVEAPQAGFRNVVQAVPVIGVLYHLSS